MCNHIHQPSGMQNIFGKKIKGRVFLKYYCSLFVLPGKQLIIKCTTYLCVNLRKTVYIQFKSLKGTSFVVPLIKKSPPM